MDNKENVNKYFMTQQTHSRPGIINRKKNNQHFRSKIIYQIFHRMFCNWALYDSKEPKYQMYKKPQNN